MGTWENLVLNLVGVAIVIVIVTLLLYKVFKILMKVRSDEKMRKIQKETAPCSNERKQRLREEIKGALFKAVDTQALSRSQEIAIVQISEILFELMRVSIFFETKFCYPNFVCTYPDKLQNIREIGIKYSLPKVVMRTALGLVFENALSEHNEDTAHLFGIIAKYMKELELGS